LQTVAPPRVAGLSFCAFASFWCESSWPM